MTVRNLEASVHARLQNHARRTKRPFQELLQYYAMERFLYRLSKTLHCTRFVLKGALLMHAWDAPLARATKDVDFLGLLDNALENLARVVREVCAALAACAPALCGSGRTREVVEAAAAASRAVDLLCFTAPSVLNLFDNSSRVL